MGETALILRLAEDGRLLAQVDPGTDRPPLDAGLVRAQLSAEGLSDLFVDQSAVADLLRAYANSPDRIELAIGERRDGLCTISVDEDKSAARLTIVPPFGGEAVNAGQVHNALRAAGVVAGILGEEITAAVAAGVARDLVVARGQDPVDGNDATFVSLLPEAEERRPHVDEHGIIDYHDLGQITSVRAGEPLMRRIPPTAGENGYDVKGRVLKARAGRNTPFASGLKGAKVSPTDPNLLCAVISGRPTVGPTGVTVEPIVAFPHVDTSTGHIDYDGSVMVHGDVRSGMRIRASRDVVIGGSVGAAQITAGGKIVVKGGVIGGGDADGSGQGHAVITCKGPFQAGFLEYATVESAAEILVGDHAMHSTLNAGSRVVIGGPGARTGQVRGGTVSASGIVKAVTFGSPMGVKTVVRVGVEAPHRARLKVVEQEITAAEKKEADLQKAVAGRHLPKEEQALAAVSEQLITLREEATRLKTCLTLAARARVIVEHKIHSGTEIHIGALTWPSRDDHASGVFRVQDGEIVFGA